VLRLLVFSSEGYNGLVKGETALGPMIPGHLSGFELQSLLEFMVFRRATDELALYRCLWESLRIFPWASMASISVSLGHY